MLQQGALCIGTVQDAAGHRLQTHGQGSVLTGYWCPIELRIKQGGC
jgi:hypothetical protein